ncbi:DMT family transporter [Thalassobius sp. Cn5-15]|uniref:DMT family transporter n=1 Tax=Thalassobius sp. Cn5-15 TaxID=2917763 RepID=UPI001EF336D2|nr:DMT family transporter [Thalassobius sp. Cn5-15]MCG7494215.1 DMT family transporter [Thalassobius sp. Cn5-15]
MRLFLLTCLTMLAFAANSLLNRAGIVIAGAEPVAFASLRLASGAVMLGALLLLRRGAEPPAVSPLKRGCAVLSLLAYIYGFSLAYQALDAGAGALVLFAMVQITMFAGAVMMVETVPLPRWLGAGLALAGLTWILWPADAAMPPLASAMMALAGVGWGIYSLMGRGASDPTRETALNFLLAAPVGIAIWSFFGAWEMGAQAILLAVLSGAVTSGLGYALWYSVLPNLGASRAAVAQLTVPVIAIIGGALLLGEWPELHFAIATLVVLSGVALGAMPARRK